MNRMEDIHDNLVVFAMDKARTVSEDDVEMLYDRILLDDDKLE